MVRYILHCPHAYLYCSATGFPRAGTPAPARGSIVRGRQADSGGHRLGSQGESPECEPVVPTVEEGRFAGAARSGARGTPTPTGRPATPTGPKGVAARGARSRFWYRSVDPATSGEIDSASDRSAVPSRTCVED